MNYSDLANGLLETIGGIMYMINIKVILKHKEVKGISLIPNIFYFLWAIFNLYFYSYNSLMFSFYGGIVLVIFSGIWLGLAVYYNYIRNTNLTLSKID